MESEKREHNLNPGLESAPGREAQGKASLFGEIAVELGFLSRENLASVLAERRQGNPATGIGESLASRGLLTRSQVNSVLEEQAMRHGSRFRRLLGHVIIERGFASSQSVDRALLEQKNRRARGLKSLLGSILAEKGAITERDLAAALKEQSCPDLKAAPAPASEKKNSPAAAAKIGGFEIIEPARACVAGKSYKARRRESSRVIMLNELEMSGPPSAERTSSFNSAGRAVTALAHEGLVQVLDFGDEGRVPWTACEICPGRRLDEHAACSVLSPRAALEIAAGIAGALAHLHGKGIMHGGLSPACVTVTPDGRVKLGGFGFHRILKTAPEATPYSSPEMLADKDGADWRSDLWSAGAILFELLSGKPPAAGAAVLPADLNPDIAAICLKSLESNPDERYQDAAELLRDIKDYLEGRAVSASGRQTARLSKPTSIKSPEKKGGCLPGAALLVLALAACAALIAG